MQPFVVLWFIVSSDHSLNAWSIDSLAVELMNSDNWSLLLEKTKKQSSEVATSALFITNMNFQTLNSD